MRPGRRPTGDPGAESEPAAIPSSMPRWTLIPVNERVSRLLDGRGLHVGNLKLIDARWKFKAIGYEADGGVVPGGGPLTDRHDTLLAAPDAASIVAAFGPG